VCLRIPVTSQMRTNILTYQPENIGALRLRRHRKVKCEEGRVSDEKCGERKIFQDNFFDFLVILLIRQKVASFCR
jgi:hypothetical protein